MTRDEEDWHQLGKMRILRRPVEMLTQHIHALSIGMDGAMTVCYQNPSSTINLTCHLVEYDHVCIRTGNLENTCGGSVLHQDGTGGLGYASTY